MHLGATAALLLRHHDNETLKNVLRRLDKDKLVGTLSYSDPATGEYGQPAPNASYAHMLTVAYVTRDLHGDIAGMGHGSIRNERFMQGY